MFTCAPTLGHFFGGQGVDGGGVIAACDKTPARDLLGFCILFGPSPRLGISAPLPDERSAATIYLFIFFPEPPPSKSLPIQACHREAGHVSLNVRSQLMLKINSEPCFKKEKRTTK